MAEDEDPEVEVDTEDPPEGEPDKDAPEDDWRPPTKEEWEKLQGRASKRDRMLREARAELAKTRETVKDDEPDPVEAANARLVRQSTRTALSDAGVPKDEHADVLDLINLSGIAVDSSGDPDEEAIEDAIKTLQRVFGNTTNGRKPRPRVDTRDKGAGGGKSDPDSDRYAKFLGRRGR